MVNSGHQYYTINAFRSSVGLKFSINFLLSEAETSMYGGGGGGGIFGGKLEFSLKRTNKYQFDVENDHFYGFLWFSP